MGFVIGFHRSGTSLLTSVLHGICGCNSNLPFTLMPSAEDNPEGFHESLELFNLNNQLLESVGHRWDSPWLAAPRFEDCMSSVDSHTVEEFLQTHPIRNDSKWIDKDPRLCLTIDMINRIIKIPLPSIGIVRNPLATCRSLRKRNGFSMDHALGLWIIYNYHAFVANSSLPNSLVTFEDLVSGEDNVANQIGDYLKAHRSRSRESEARARHIDLQEITRHLKERTKPNLVHWEESNAQENNNNLMNAAMEMWRALTRVPSSTYYPTAEVKDKASEAISLALSKYSQIIPCTSYSCYTMLAKSCEDSLERQAETSKSAKELSERLESFHRIHHQAIQKLDEEIQLTRSEQVYWQAQHNESAIVIRELQSEIMELVLKGESLQKKLDWYRKIYSQIQDGIRKSHSTVMSLQLRLAQLISVGQ